MFLKSKIEKKIEGSSKLKVSDKDDVIKEEKEDIEEILDSDELDSKKDSKLQDEGLESMYKRVASEVRAYEESFKAYQNLMNEYFNEANTNDYSKSYDGSNLGTSRVTFDVSENQRKRMISHTKELFKSVAYSGGGDKSLILDPAKRNEYELWKASSALNQAMAFIYYDRPDMIDSLGEE